MGFSSRDLILFLSTPILADMGRIDLAAGTNFFDTFEQHEYDLWRKEQNDIFCSNDKWPECFYATLPNLQYSMIADDFPTHSYLEITLRNDCDGPKCCEKDLFCTKYIGGQITSKPLYAYGSFRFLALVEDVSKDELRAGKACFGLVGSNQQKERIEISMCISVLNPRLATLYHAYEHVVYREEVSLEFDAATTLAIYRIDWSHKFIRFYIKGKLVGTFRKSERYLPDEPMFITVAVYPDDMENPTASEKQIKVRLHLYRARYIAMSAKRHEDLFVLTEDSSLKQNMIVFICIIGAGLMMGCHVTGFCKREEGIGQYSLLQEVNETKSNL